MKRNIEQSYEYSGNINDLLNKPSIGKYYDDYMINYYNETSFAIEVERLGHSS